MILDLLKDDRANCYSLMVQMTINEYLDKIQSSFEKKGGLEGQRETIKTKTAQKIRERMIEDLRNGAILPPIVLGAILDSEQIEVLNTENLKHEVINSDNLSKLVERIPKEDLFIIDGMQRTTALSEARKEKLKINEKLIRVEYWLASEVNSITYRMLVLNTSQIPWNLRRQLEVVYSSIVKELGSIVVSGS
jgi:adenylate kinase family enzyme